MAPRQPKRQYNLQHKHVDRSCKICYSIRMSEYNDEPTPLKEILEGIPAAIGSAEQLALDAERQKQVRQADADNAFQVASENRQALIEQSKEDKPSPEAMQLASELLLEQITKREATKQDPEQ